MVNKREKIWKFIALFVLEKSMEWNERTNEKGPNGVCTELMQFLGGVVSPLLCLSRSISEVSGVFKVSRAIRHRQKYQSSENRARNQRKKEKRKKYAHLFAQIWLFFPREQHHTGSCCAEHNYKYTEINPVFTSVGIVAATLASINHSIASHPLLNYSTFRMVV